MPSPDAPSGPSREQLEAKIISPMEGLTAMAKQLGFGKWVDAAERISEAAQAISTSLGASKALTSMGGGVEEPILAELVKEGTTAVQASGDGSGLAGAAAQAASSVTRAATTAVADGAAVAEGAAVGGAASAAGGAVAGGAAGGASAGLTGLAGLSAAAGPAGIAIAALGATALAAGYAAKQFADAMQAEANKLADWSESLSGAIAESDIARERAELRRADAIGPELAKFEKTRSEVANALYDIKTGVLDALLTAIQPALPAIEVTARVVSTIPDSLRLVHETLGGVTAILTLDRADAAKHADNAEKLLKDISDKLTPEDADEIDPFTAAFLSMGLAVPGAPATPAPIGLPPGIVGGPPIGP
jgi:hypothetical protein